MNEQSCFCFWILLFIGLCGAASMVQRDVDIVTVTVAPAIPSDEPSYSSFPTFTSAILNSTNTYRTEHNASSVRWNNTLADFASSYLKSNTVCKFAHSGGPYGENIAMGYQNATAAVEAWGDERKDYNFGKGDFTEGTGHFTQLVWKDTTDVGCGTTLCGDRGWFLACEYWPRGNVIGDFKDEVQTRLGLGLGNKVNEPGMIVVGLLLVIITFLGMVG